MDDLNKYERWFSRIAFVTLFLGTVYIGCQAIASGGNMNRRLAEMTEKLEMYENTGGIPNHRHKGIYGEVDYDTQCKQYYSGYFE